MDSDYHQPYNQMCSGNQHPHQQRQQQQSQTGSGLTRLRSAPSSFFANLLDRDFCEEFLNRPSSPETERILVRLISGGDGETPQQQQGEEPEMKPKARDFVPPQQQPGQGQGQGRVSYQRQSGSLQQLQPAVSNRDSGFGGTNQVGMDRFGQAKQGSSLTRHSSSPAGLFSDINIDESGFVSMDNMRGDYGGGGGSRLGNNHQMNYSSSRPQQHPPPPSSSSMGHHMSPIAEEKAFIRDQQESDFGSWEDAVSVSENFSVFDRNPEFKPSDNKAGRSRPPLGLSHHLSLPKATVDLSAIDKFLQMQDSVPCKIRAKRGFATHPRSIAERVRRTKISERMRKLQDLVPNMDKQTNTADMLDLAVDYVKELQKQVKALSSQRARCTCSNGQQHQLQSS